MDKIRKTKANRVSGGERRRLEIARSLITEPKLIMLDEPFAGIDPKTVAEIQDQIRALVETYNIGILLTDHQFRETLEVTDRCYLIREGRVFAYGSREDILNNPDVRRHYIGERFDVGHLLEKRRPNAIAQASRSESHEVPTATKPAELPDLSSKQIIIGEIGIPRWTTCPVTQTRFCQTRFCPSTPLMMTTIPSPPWNIQSERATFRGPRTRKTRQLTPSHGEPFRSCHVSTWTAAMPA